MTPLSWESHCPFSKKMLISFIVFEILFHVTASTKNIFCIGNGLNLPHLSVAPKFYNGPIPLNEAWPCLFIKYFSKLLHIYQLNILRLHLWKFGFCSSRGKLRSHYSVFLGVWLPFPPKNFGKVHNFLTSFVVTIISWKYEACSWWIEIYPEMSPICLVPGPSATKCRKADRMDFSHFENRTMFGGQNILRKMGWNYPSRALCLLFPFGQRMNEWKKTDECDFSHYHFFVKP